MEQRTTEWMQSRAGRFTGSAIHRLMTSGKGEMFGKTAKSYIMEKVAEILTNGESTKAHEFENAATRWGNEWEPYARKVYQEFTFNKVEECSFFTHGDRFGASPDGIIEAEGILEIKCPFTTEKHIEFLLCKDARGLFEVAPEYYYQMQAEMICTGLQWGDFVSYDPRCDERTCLKIIRVPYDKIAADEILERVGAGSKIINETLKKIADANQMQV